MSQNTSIIKKDRIILLTVFTVSLLLIYGSFSSIRYAFVPRVKTDCRVINSTSEFKICNINGYYGNCQYTKINFTLNWQGLIINKEENIEFNQPSKIANLIECYFRADSIKETLTINSWTIPDRFVYGFFGFIGIFVFFIVGIAVSCDIVSEKIPVVSDKSKNT